MRKWLKTASSCNQKELVRRHVQLFGLLDWDDKWKSRYGLLYKFCQCRFLWEEKLSECPNVETKPLSHWNFVKIFMKTFSDATAASHNATPAERGTAAMLTLEGFKQCSNTYGLEMPSWKLPARLLKIPVRHVEATLFKDWLKRNLDRQGLKLGLKKPKRKA